MKDIASDKPAFTGMYGAEEWGTHLSKATSLDQSKELFVSLSQFFITEGVKVWIKCNLLKKMAGGFRVPSNPLHISIETNYLQSVHDWIQQCPECMKVEDSEMPVHLNNTTESAWSELVECFGKAAANLWLNEDLTCDEAQVSFLLALKYFLKRKTRSASNLSEVNDLISTDFEGILAWAGGGGKQRVKKQNLGMAFLTLQQWESCIRCLDDNSTEVGRDTLKYLGVAFMANRDYDGAIRSFKRFVEKDTYSFWLRPGLFEAYEAKGDYDAAIEFFSHCADERSSVGLAYAYIGKENYDAAIEMLDSLKGGRFEDETVVGLYTAYMLKRDYVGGIVGLSGRRYFPFNLCLARLCMANRNYEGAINCCNNDNKWLNYEYLLAKMACGEHDHLICKFENDVECRDGYWEASELSIIVEMLKTKGNFERALSVLEKAVDKSKSNRQNLLWCILEIYKAKREHDKAIEMFESFVTKYSICELDDIGRSLYSVLDACETKSDYDAPIRVVDKCLPIEKGIKSYSNITLLSLLKLFIARKDYERPVKILEAAVEFDPFNPRMWHTLGELYIAKADYDAAISVYQSAVRQISIDYSFYKQLGDLHLLKSHYGAAINAYNLAIENARSDSILWAYLSTTISELETPIKIDKFLTRNFVWISLAKAHNAISDEEGARTIYDSAIKTYQATLEKTSKNRLLWRYREPDLEQWLLDVFYLKSTLPEAVVWFALGKAYKCKGEIKNALDAFRNALNCDVTNVWLQGIIHDLSTNLRSSRSGTFDFDYPLQVKEESEHLKSRAEWMIEGLPIGSLRKVENTIVHP
jgi:tetratricopeptide (TPR) repeat protein